MTKNFNIAILLQILCTILYLVHLNKSQGLGSDFMFWILLFSMTTSVFLFWQILKIGNIVGTQKIIGLLCASLPFLFLVLFLFYFYKA
jgi:hypothetical protein